VIIAFSPEVIFTRCSSEILSPLFVKENSRADFHRNPENPGISRKSLK
jgi:hypothetical protein